MVYNKERRMRDRKSRFLKLGVRLSLLAGVSFFLLVWGNMAVAGPKITLKPMVTVAGKYDSNFYGVEKGERGVYTLLVQPGIKVGMVMPKTSVEFAYALEGYVYQDSSTVPEGQRKASDLNYIGHLFNLALNYQPTRRLNLGLTDSFYMTRYPYYYDRLTTIIDKRKYWINRFSPNIFYDFKNRLSAGLRYDWRRIRYDKDEVEEVGEGTFYGDSDSHELGLAVGYNPTRTTTLDFDYKYMQLEYVDGMLAENDYKMHWFMLQGQKRYKYFAFDAGIGWQTRDYPNDTAVQTNDDFTFKLGITGQSPPPSERRRHLGRVFLRPMDHFYLGWIRMPSTYGEYYTADRFTLSVGNLFYDRINVQLRGWYQISDYNEFTGITAGGGTETRYDETFDASARVGYLFTDVLALNLTGGRQERDSNLSGYGYINNYAILSLDFNYDIGAIGGFVREAMYYW
ncbi:MAG: hypothetical protein JRJ60_03635 [Deltaproteobacteria bacterium]|nr:hypothetical protein [Deltaproteobacteria bacterium]